MVVTDHFWAPARFFYFAVNILKDGGIYPCQNHKFIDEKNQGD